MGLTSNTQREREKEIIITTFYDVLFIMHKCSHTWELRPPKGLGASGPIF